jgi:hypothetical protein
MAHGPEPALSHVEAALESLVQRGVLVRRPLPGGASIYSRAAPVPRRPSSN